MGRTNLASDLHSERVIRVAGAVGAESVESGPQNGGGVGAGRGGYRSGIGAGHAANKSFYSAFGSGSGARVRRLLAVAKWAASCSMPMKRRPRLMHASPVVPLPIVGSSTRSPGSE